MLERFALELPFFIDSDDVGSGERTTRLYVGAEVGATGYVILFIRTADGRVYNFTELSDRDRSTIHDFYNGLVSEFYKLEERIA